MFGTTTEAIKDFDVKRRLGRESPPKALILVKSLKFPKNIYFQGHYWVRSIRFGRFSTSDFNLGIAIYMMCDLGYYFKG